MSNTRLIERINLIKNILTVFVGGPLGENWKIRDNSLVARSYFPKRINDKYKRIVDNLKKIEPNITANLIYLSLPNAEGEQRFIVDIPLMISLIFKNLIKVKSIVESINKAALKKLEQCKSVRAMIPEFNVDLGLYVLEDNVSHCKDALNQLDKVIEQEKKEIAGIKTNTLVLAQAARTRTSFFDRLPRELLVNIASMSVEKDIISESDAHTVASRHFEICMKR